MADVVRGLDTRPDRRWYHEHPKRAYEAIAAGQPVYVRTDGRLAKARANAAGTARVFGFAATKVAAGDTVTVILRGAMTGFSNLTPGTYLWLSAANAGELADAPPATGGFSVPLAYVTTASDVELMCPAFAVVVP